MILFYMFFNFIREKGFKTTMTQTSTTTSLPPFCRYYIGTKLSRITFRPYGGFLISCIRCVFCWDLYQVAGHMYGRCRLQFCTRRRATILHIYSAILRTLASYNKQDFQNHKDFSYMVLLNRVDLKLFLQNRFGGKKYPLLTWAEFVATVIFDLSN